MTDPHLDHQIAGLAALGEPARRALYAFVVAQRREVSRDEAARALEISRALAGFHLDRLVNEGLLEATFRRLSGRTGPGAGRPAKLYRRSSRELAVSLPPRRYELAAGIFAAAVDSTASDDVRAAVGRSARSAGEAIAADARAHPPAGETRPPLAVALAALSAQGFAPEQTAATVRLGNCPFHALVGEHKALVCGMNLALVEGIVAALGVEGATPALDPQPGMCCVCIRLGGAVEPGSTP